jgi:hypothetical protein
MLAIAHGRPNSPGIMHGPESEPKKNRQFAMTKMSIHSLRAGVNT